MVRDFDDNEFPPAYLITFWCYGTWVHGDGRGSTDRKQMFTALRRKRLTHGFKYRTRNN